MSDLREKLAEAGKKFDGHVTNGGLDAQMKVIEDEFQRFQTLFEAQMKAIKEDIQRLQTEIEKCRE